MAPRCSNSGHQRRQPWVLQADGPSLKIRVSSPYRWQLGSGQISVKVALCRSVLANLAIDHNRSHPHPSTIIIHHPPSQKSLRFLPKPLQRFGDATLYAGISMQHEVECCQYAVSHVVYGLRLTDLAVCTHTLYAHAHALNSLHM